MNAASATRGSRGRPRAVVTGGAGFIGSHLVDRLLAEGTDVLIVDDLSTGQPANIAAEARLERSDIVTADLERIFRDWRPSAVFHLAAQASVPLSISDPLRDLAVNVAGTHRVAAAALAAGAGRLVFVSSGGAVYGESVRPATERTSPAPGSYYGVHKLAGEGHIALAGLPYAIARPANVYGPRQAAGLEGAVVAAFIDQANASRTVRIHGDGRQTRDFVHVRDVVDALIRMSQPSVTSGTWNVATGRSVSVETLAGTVERALGRRLERVYGPRRAGDVTHSKISAARLRRLGWRPTIRLPAGLSELAR